MAPPLVEVPVPFAVAVPPLGWVAVAVEPPDDVVVFAVVPVGAPDDVVVLAVVPVALDVEELDA